MSTQQLAKKPTQSPSILEDFFGPWNDWFSSYGIQPRMLTTPAVNVTENDDQFGLSLAAPGLKKDDFTVECHGNMLTVSGQKEEKKEEKEENFTRKEYNYSSFSRSFTLPEGVDSEKIEAKYDEGILKITLPKKEEAKKAKNQKIDIK